LQDTRFSSGRPQSEENHVPNNFYHELEQWRDHSSTDNTLTSLTLIETSVDEIREMDTAILREEEEATTELPSLLKLLIKKTRILGNNPQIREW